MLHMVLTTTFRSAQPDRNCRILGPQAGSSDRKRLRAQVHLPMASQSGSGEVGTQSSLDSSRDCRRASGNNLPKPPGASSAILFRSLLRGTLQGCSKLGETYTGKSLLAKVTSRNSNMQYPLCDTHVKDYLASLKRAAGKSCQSSRLARRTQINQSYSTVEFITSSVARCSKESDPSDSIFAQPCNCSALERSALRHGGLQHFGVKRSGS